MKLTDYRIGIFNTHWWSDFWYKQVSCRIHPRNKWLTKQIPRTWEDKDVLLEIVVLECLKHYCDKNGEDCFNTICDDTEFMKQAKYYYDLTTQKLVELQKELDVEWEKIPLREISDIEKTTMDDYNQLYGKINKLEDEIENFKTEIMVWIVKNRSYMWT